MLLKRSEKQAILRMPIDVKARLGDYLLSLG